MPVCVDRQHQARRAPEAANNGPALRNGAVAAFISPWFFGI
jgi:hypothetical protein